MSENPLRLAVLADFREEEWTSMELVAEMLLDQARGHTDIVTTRVQPRMIRSASHLPWLRENSRLARNLDRGVARYLQYSMFALRLRGRFDAYHVVDHSYSHLGLFLPGERTGIFCHDLDAFQAALAPTSETEPWRRRQSSLLLRGIREAAIVFYSTQAVRVEMQRFGLVDPSRLVQAPYGVAEEFKPGPEPRDPRLLVHVGSVVPRKNIDFLLKLVGELRKSNPGVRLVQVGGTWQPRHLELIRELNLTGSVRQVRGISRSELASYYRSAGAVLMPSRAEGFGIPVAEALACGATVVASDIAVLREVGGDAVLYSKVSDLEDWASCVERTLHEDGTPSLSERLGRASLYSWQRHATVIMDAYRKHFGVRA